MRKLLDGVKDFAAKVKAAFGGERDPSTAPVGSAQDDTGEAVRCDVRDDTVGALRSDDTGAIVAKDKYGAKVEELERAAYLWEKMLSDTETAVASGNKKTAGEGTGGRMYLIKENAEGKYVKAERQVIFGNDPEEWGEQVENFINKQILAGQTVEIPTEDGDTLLLNEQTAGKASFRNFLRNENRYMNDEEYLTKLDAEAHIDELAQISKRGDKVVPDSGGIHGEMAKDGWNYRTAHFEDFDGKYYRLIISTALGENGKTVYNISGIRERSFPTFSGSSATNSGAHRNFVQNEKTIGMKASSEDTIPQVPEKSNRENGVEGDSALAGASASLRFDSASGSAQNDTGTARQVQNAKDKMQSEGDPSAEPQDDTGETQRRDASHGEVVRDDNYKRAKLKSREGRVLDALAKVTGTKIRFVETLNEGKTNAEYSDGEIRIALDSEDPVRVAVVHEVIHRLRETSPESYRALSEFVFNNLTDEELELLRRDFGEGYSELSPDGVSEEIVAQAFGVIMGDKNRVDALIESDRSTWEKICDVLNDFIISIRRALSGERAAQISEYDRIAFSGLLSKAEEMEKVLREALDASQVQNAKGKVQDGAEGDPSTALRSAQDDTGEAVRSAQNDTGAEKSTSGEVNEGIKFSKKGSNEETSIKQQMKEHLDELNDMDVVVSVAGRGIEGRNKTKLKQDIIEGLKPTGYQVERQGFGKISFSEKEIKGALNYLGTDAEIAAFKALPRVLKRGIIVGEHSNHKVRGYDTVTIAAPIQLNGKRAIMAVVVKMETNNEYKVHRIIAPDGGRFEYEKNREAEPTPGSVLNSQKNEQNLPISSASIDSISESDGNVNTKSSRKRMMRSAGRYMSLRRRTGSRRSL